MEYLLLKTSKGTFNRLTLSVIWHSGLVQNGNLIKKALCGKFGMTTLIVIYYFVWTDTCKIYRHTECAILAVECFFRSDVVTYQCLTIGIHHFVDGSGAHLSGFIPVIQVQFRTIRIPKGITHLRKLRL